MRRESSRWLLQHLRGRHNASLAAGSEVTKQQVFRTDCIHLLQKLERDEVEQNALYLIRKYIRSCKLGDAEQVFKKMTYRGAVTWTVMISAYCRNHEYGRALLSFRKMQLEGIAPDKVAFVVVLSMLDDEYLQAEGRRIHLHIIESGAGSDNILGNALICMYGKCSSVDDAKATFDGMPHKDVISWNSIIAVYAQQGQTQEALSFYRQMQQEGILPQRITFINILTACNCSTALADGKMIHACIIEKALDSELIVGNAILNMYAKCESPDDARLIFEKMIVKDVVSWTAAIAAYALQSQHQQAFAIFRKMQLQGVVCDSVTFITLLDGCSSPDALIEGRMVHARVMEIGLDSQPVVANSLVNMYGKCGSLKEARRLFDTLPVRDVVSWNAMLTGYTQQGHAKEALHLFLLMNIKPDRTSFMTVVNSCATILSQNEQEAIHSQASKYDLLLDVVVATCLINMYVKCQRLDSARKVFNQMHDRSLVTWNSMISAYVQIEQYAEALELYKKIPPCLSPDKITFMAALNACAGLSSMRDGVEIHSAIRKSSLEANVMVGAALVDMYGKCGSLQKAYEAFEEMPEPNLVSWNSIIAAYAHHGHFLDSVRIFQKMVQVGGMPDRISFINVLYACSHGGLMDDGSCLFVSMEWDYEISAEVEHYGCMADLLSRLGWIEAAEFFLRKMPMEANVVMWTSFLNACRGNGDGQRAKSIAENVVKLDPHSSSSYVALSSTYVEDEYICDDES